MRRIGWLAAVLLAGTALPAVAQGGSDPGPDGPIQYDVRFDNAAHHEARISVTYRRLRPGPVRFQMARSSPGRYALHEFAKNVYAVSAVDGRGRPLAMTRSDPYGWGVPTHDGTVTVSYTLFGDRGDGTYAQVDTSHAHLNMPASFLWAVGYDERPLRVRFHPLDPTWKVATQLPAAREAMTFWAPNLQYFMDSPTELAPLDVREWKVGDQTLRLAVHHLGTPAEVDAYVARLKRVTAQHAALFGGLPRFDYGSYTFLADYVPWVSGDGMEHRNSTSVPSPMPLTGDTMPKLGTASHEFVHAWNVERLRPAELEPFDFTRANPSPSLWVAEGFTQYYGPLLIRRAGEQSLDGFLKGLSGTLDYVVNSPARRYGGPQEMSLRAPFVDAATAIDPVNPHIFVSYYPYGAVIALALDLTLRQRFPGKSLDDYMRLLWRTHGVTERPYTPDDLRTALATLTGDQAFADKFFAESVTGSALPDFKPLLAQAGLVLRRARPQGGWIGGASVRRDGQALVIEDGPPPESPLYRAGLDQGDVIVSLDAAPIADATAWQAALAKLTPGQRVRLVFRQRGRERTAIVAAVADPTLEVVAAESAGERLSEAQRAFRESWLGR